MLVKTKAIVLHALKFQDTSLIVKCFTKENGIKSYLLKGILTKKKSTKLNKAQFQLGSLLELVTKNSSNNHLNYINEARVYYQTPITQTNIYKSSLVLFMTEILINVLKEEEQNIQLYDFLETSFIQLNKTNNFANFHIVFLLNLSAYLGFYPQVQHKNALCFDLSEGVFTNHKPKSDYLINKDLSLFKQIIGINFDTTISLTKKEKQQVLQILINYFSLHLPEFKKPKSLYVFQTIFQ
jgi:DNA repair protein RecO (recombination protein O)